MMHERRILEKKSLGALFQKLTAAGQRIVAPVRDGKPVAGQSCRSETRAAAHPAEAGAAAPVRFAEVTAPEQVAADYVQTVDSAKAAVFPRYEHLLRFRLAGKDVQVEEITPAAPPTVLFGLHPCDAASFATLKAVFTWDSADAYFEPKLAQTTVIGLSCTRGDSYCFCTSVGGGPGDARGSDILLTPLDPARFLAEILTDKGAAVVRLAPELFTPANGAAKQAALATIPPRFKVSEFSARLPALFGKIDLWREQSLRCLGCGACAFVCPTCSCFDIQDERERFGGLRLRCWDSCGFGLFTLHASGHNPRPRQSERWRQRVMHKFSYQPERLGVLGCVGCGRCSRACPADMNLAEHLQALAEVNP